MDTGDLDCEKGSDSTDHDGNIKELCDSCKQKTTEIQMWKEKCKKLEDLHEKLSDHVTELQLKYKNLEKTNAKETEANTTKDNIDADTSNNLSH